MLGRRITKNKFDFKGLSEVFVDAKAPTAIQRRLTDRTAIEILNIEDLPKENTVGSFDNVAFRDAKLSPDKTKIAFSVKTSPEGWSRDWSGIYELKNKKIKKLNSIYYHLSGELSWSPDGMYVVEQLRGPYFNLIVRNIEDEGWALPVGKRFLLERGIEMRGYPNYRSQVQKNISCSYFHFFKWAENSKKVLIELVKAITADTEGPVSKIISRETIGIFSIDLDTFELKNEGNKK